ncbi:hypothetical protein [Asticcacaulis sp. AC402]|uniref:hypothetical protein n=1 Tax=Asticcacaulis sp. AC402 TaxID=1282361 RepID=UPI000416E348|nr:hypothetical protein [Asticcacaulis sp. AC402]
MRFEVTERGNFNEWRDAARDLLRHPIVPRHVGWGFVGDGASFQVWAAVAAA